MNTDSMPAAWPSARWIPPLVALALMVGGPVTPARAQTGLVVVTTGDSAWTARVRGVAATVRWIRGPVTVSVLPDSAPSGWDTAIDSSLGRHEHPVVIVPVVAAPGEGSELLNVLLRRGQTETGRATTVTKTVVVAAGESAANVARRIETVGEAGVRAAHALVAWRTPRNEAYRVRDLNITATRAPRAGFDTPMSVTVLDDLRVRERQVNSAADLFLEVPGLDLDGVGTTQRQPIIRGLQGQRILLLEDGLRLNNSRRRQDSGEIPALVDPSTIERVEIVRGAASVLYGSDAIGGVVNLITREPPRAAPGSVVHGELGYRYSTVDNQSRPSATVFGRSGPVSFRLGGSYRSADAYEAPGGTFGNVSLAGDTRVRDTGVEDYTASGSLGYQFSNRHSAFAKYERYRAEQAGFGFVDPSVLGEGLSTVRLVFPFQRFERYTVGYRGDELGLGPMDGAEVTAYLQDNERDFHTNVFTPFPPPAAPDAGVSIASRNFTDISTYGFRAEFKKVVAGRHVVTYGLDLYRDNSRNTDTTITTILGAGPPTPRVRDIPRLPDATFRSLGGFIQMAFSVGPRADLIIGGRYQDVRARTRPTPGLSDPLFADTDRNLVGSASMLYRATPTLSIVATVGRAFRSPNLVERFFNGPSPEGRGFWIRNLDLRAETSLNLEAGVRYRSGPVYLEGFVFRNTVYDAIRTVPTGNEVDGVTEFQNINIDELRIAGVELTATTRVGTRLTLGAGYAHVSPRVVNEPDVPLGDGYSHKLTGTVRYAWPDSRYWVEYAVRHNGRRDDVALGTSPVGNAIPAFTVHAIRGGFSLGRQRLTVSVTNLTNTLYAESPNVGFFRPEPKRSLALTWAVGF